MCETCGVDDKILKFIHPEFPNEDAYVCTHCGYWWIEDYS